MIFTDIGPRKTRKFVLAPGFLDQFRGKQPKWGYAGLGYLTYKRTYARPTCDCEGVGSCNHPTEEYWQTCQRVVEGVYNIQKIHCRNLNLPWSEQKAQKSAQEMFLRMWEFKFSPPGRGLWVMGTDLLYLKGSAALNNCFAPETRIFIEDEEATGIGSHVRLASLGDLAAFSRGERPVKVQTNTGIFKPAIARSFGVQKLVKVSFAPRGIRSNYRMEYDVTPNHRWILADGSETTTLKVGDTVKIRPFGYMLFEASPEGTEGFAHGLVFGDGSQHTYYPERHQIRLCGEKEQKHVERLERSQYHFNTTHPESYNGDAMVWFKLDKGMNWKALPSKDSNVAYQRAFLHGWLAADGTQKPAGTVCLNTQNHEAAQWLIERAPLLGFCVTGVNYESVMEANYGPRSAPMVRITLTTETTEYTVKSITDEGREEEVYCVTEPETGTFTLEGGLVTGNCAFTTSVDIDTDFAGPFCFLMDMSMFGVGVGGDTKGAGKVKITTPRATDVPYVVEDSREGWVELVRVVLNSFAGKGAFPLTIDFSQVRKRGTPLKTFGGIASGPDPLVSLVKNLTKLLLPPGVSAVFEGYEVECGVLTVRFEGENLEGYKITSSQIVDIFNYVGKCVVSGGIRRTAEIMFGDPSDKEFLALKQDMEALGDRRWASNNSIFAQKGMDYTEIAGAIALNGEPGVAWLENMRNYSRMNGSPDYKDVRVMGSNPCVEQSLEDREVCCLVETYPAHHDSLEDYKRTLKFAYLYAKTVTLVPTHDPRTNAVVMRNRRIGCSQSGIIQAVNKLGRTEYKRWCDEGYDAIQDWDRTYSEWLCVPRSVKTTSVKPSGTVSLLAGATPGIHFPHSEYYIRHVRIANTSPLVQACRDAGYGVYDDPYAPDTSVVAFPVHEQNFGRSKDDVGIWEQFANAAMLQRYWADNQVSVTVTFRKDEVDQIKPCLEAFEDQLKAVSLLPLADGDHGYHYAPYVKIDAETYERLSANLQPIVMDAVSHEADDKFCDGGSCTISFEKEKG